MFVKGKKDGLLAFEMNQNGFIYHVDASKEHGGEDKGPSPKGLLLSGLIGCTGVDVVSILDKMKEGYDDLEITADTDLTDEHPKVFKDITLKYMFKGTGINETKIKRAVSLSQDKYCGVSAMLEKNSRILSEIYINGEKIQ